MGAVLVAVICCAAPALIAASAMDVGPALDNPVIVLAGGLQFIGVLGTPAVSAWASVTRRPGRLASSALRRRGLHEPDDGPAVWCSLLADEMEAEGPIERHVARVASFEEGGHPSARAHLDGLTRTASQAVV
jgi:hypothetical protein